MSDFVEEKVNQLNSVLLELFQNQFESSKTLKPISDFSSINKSPLNNFLLSAIQNVQSTPIPNHLDQIQHQLKTLLDLLDVDTDEASERLAWLFLAQCTITMYGSVLRKLLVSTVPLSEAINYWNKIYGSKRNEFYYALQTLPIRVTHFGIKTAKKIYTACLGFRDPSKPSEGFLLLDLFPLYTANRQEKRLLGQKSYVFLKTMGGSLFMKLIRLEIEEKIKTLTESKTQNALELSYMIQYPPFLLSSPHESLALQLNGHLSAIHSLFRRTSLGDSIVEKVDGTVKGTAKNLFLLVESWHQHEARMFNIQTLNGPVSFWTRNWIPSLATCFAMKAAIEYALENKDTIKQWLNESEVLVRSAFDEWVKQPILHVWDTIRLKDDTLSMIAKEKDVHHEFNSLKAKIIEFAKKYYQMSDSEINKLLENVQEGDMFLILKAYEDEIKRPFKNTVSGDLMTTLLIQIQKTSIDMDSAIIALNKLLQSNELNFAFLAIAPSIIASWGLLYWLRLKYQKRAGRRLGHRVRVPIQTTMMRIERLLNQTQAIYKPDISGHSTGDLDPEVYKNDHNRIQGILLCEVYLLRTYAQHLPKYHSIRDVFIEDLRDLENPLFTLDQKRKVVDRMYRFWPFLRD